MEQITTNKKELKDYLHLYLGCNCKIKNGDGFWNGTWQLISVGIRFSEVYSINGANNIIKNEDIKLILRPLSAMTEEDYKDWVKIDKVNISDKYSTTRWEAERTKYLLSKNFDLFGLIEAGLAIDKTKLK